jgi:hypothetical protein
MVGVQRTDDLDFPMTLEFVNFKVDDRELAENRQTALENGTYCGKPVAKRTDLTLLWI